MTETADGLFQAGEIQKALKMLEKAIFIHDNLMGLKASFFDHVLSIINSKALAYLDLGLMDQSILVLKSSEFMIRRRGKHCSPETKIETFNNIGLWFRKRGFFNQATEYFDKAKHICSVKKRHAGRTLMNSAAMHSVMGK